MSCKAEIIVAYYEDALYVPVQSVIQVGGEYVVYVVNGSSLERRKVKVGLDNNRTIHILEGLQEGEKVLLNPPLKEAEAPATGLGPKEGESAELLSEQIRRHLKEIESSVSTPQESVSSSQGDSASVGSRRQNTSDAQNQSFSQRDARRRRLENMTPEQMEEMRRRFESMTPEQREEMRKRFESRAAQEGGTEEQVHAPAESGTTSQEGQ